MTMLLRVVLVMALVQIVGVKASALSLQQPEQQGQFIPVDQLPPQQELPAAPLLIGAYAFVLLMFFAYVVSVSRRLTAVQGEVSRLEADMKRGGKS